MKGPAARAISVFLALGGLSACTSVAVERRGAPQTRVVSRVVAADAQTLRAAILKRFGAAGDAAPSPFHGMRAHELKPPRFDPDWLAGFVDPGGFLTAYQRLPAVERADDVLLDEPTGDVYWPSEYFSAAGAVKFQCGFILHFSPAGLPAAAAGATVGARVGATEVQVFEKVPVIWAGEHWAWLHEGIGYGRVHDIRMVEPTVKDRLEVLDLLGEMGAAR